MNAGHLKPIRLGAAGYTVHSALTTKNTLTLLLCRHSFDVMVKGLDKSFCRDAKGKQMVWCDHAVNLKQRKEKNLTWKESLAGLRGAMGLSVLQKWMVDGRGLGVNNTGVCMKRICK